MPILYLDIETGPAVYRTPDERQAHAAKKVPANYSKPETIAKWIDENADDVHRKTSLEALNGSLLCVGWCWDEEDQGSHCVSSDVRDGMTRAEVDETERETLECLLAGLDQQLASMRRAPNHNHVSAIVTFRGASFDIPWLMMRALRYRLPALARLLPWQRYDRRCVDLYTVLAGPDPRNSPGRLDDIAHYLLGHGKPDGIDGSKVWDYWQTEEGRQLVTSYCMGDAELCRSLHDLLADVRGST